MGSSKARKLRRSNLQPPPYVERLTLAGVSQGIQPQGILSGPFATNPTIAGDPGGGGWGIGSPGAIPASGKNPKVNPWMLPKQAGLSVISQTYPSNYYVEWTPAAWRKAGDLVMNQGWTVDLATMYVWAYQSSPFIQSLFRTIETAINSVPFFYTDKKGNVIPEWTAELCNKSWQQELRREIAFTYFWGFSGFNFDPIGEKLYKYPMQDLDPLNRFLRQSTYSPFDGVFFDDMDNTLFVQPNTTQEGFLGWMFAIVRQYVMMHLNDENWIAAGKRLAFPVFSLGYPESMDVTDPETGEIVNPYKDEANLIAKNLGPGSTVVFPFIRAADGEIQKNIELEFDSPGSSQKAHSIYLDFNEEKKNEIRELVLGGTLTADVGDSGSRALGEVQERKLRTFMSAVIEYVISVHNGDYLRKIRRWYKNMPDGQFNINRQKQFTIEEIIAWSQVLASSGKRFTTEFFETNGFAPNFIEDMPTAGAADGDKGLTKKNDGRIQELHTILSSFRQLRSWFR